MTMQRVAAAGLVLAVGALAGAAEPPRDEPNAEPTPLLKGPEVEDTRAPGTDSRFSPGMEVSREMERPVPLRVYERILQTMRAPADKEADKDADKDTGSDPGDDAAVHDVDESVRLSATQQREIDTILREHQQAMRAFYREHREEFQELRGAAPRARPSDQPGVDAAPARRRPGAPSDDAKPRTTDAPERDAPGGPASATPPGGGKDAGDAEGMNAQTARQRLQELRAKGPSESSVIEKIWAVLEEPQRAHVEAGIEKYRAEMMRQREMRRLEEREDARGAQNELDRLPPRVRERLESMSPEERERALERLRQRRESGRDAGRGGDDRRRAPEPKPAPSMDGVDVPTTDD